MPTLELVPALELPGLVAPATAAALRALDADVAAQVQVAPIDPSLADTAEFCAAYDVPLDRSANCLVVAGRRGERTTYAAVVVLATTRADVNGVVRRLLDARRASFAPMTEATALTGMDYGGITPIGLPADWRVLVDARVCEAGDVVVGAGIRAAKILLPGAVLCRMPGSRWSRGSRHP